jgi:hypothetical protein
MPMEMIVGPAMPMTDRRSPERPAENAADHPAGYGANRTGDEEAGSCAGSGANPIGPCRRCNNSRGGRKRSRRQEKLFHLVRPPTLLAGCRATRRENRPVKQESLMNSWQSSGGF